MFLDPKSTIGRYVSGQIRAAQKIDRALDEIQVASGCTREQRNELLRRCKTIAQTLPIPIHHSMMALLNGMRLHVQRGGTVESLLEMSDRELCNL